jgi:hypothetical protein
LFFLGRCIEAWSPPKRTKYKEGYYTEDKCKKCKGKGWFGRGRPPCPVCDGKCTVTNYHKHEWIEGTRDLSKEIKSRAFWIYYCNRLVNLGFVEKKRDFLWRFEKAAERGGYFVDEWVANLKLCSSYSEEEKKEIHEKIKQEFKFWKRQPAIEFEKERYWERENWDRQINVWADRHCVLMRAALTFGCVCPVTGEKTKPKASTQDPFDCWGEDELANEFGFVASPQINIWDKEEGGLKRVYVHPFSERGIKTIKKTFNRTWDKFGSYNHEWAMADIIGGEMTKRATIARKLAA